MESPRRYRLKSSTHRHISHEEVKRDSPNPKMGNKHEDDQRNFKVKKKIEVSDNHFSEEAQSGSFTDWDQVFGEIEKIFSGHLECGQEQIRGVESDGFSNSKDRPIEVFE